MEVIVSLVFSIEFGINFFISFDAIRVQAIDINCGLTCEMFMPNSSKSKFVQKRFAIDAKIIDLVLFEFIGSLLIVRFVFKYLTIH